MPDSESSSSPFISSAIDAVNIGCNLLCYLEEGGIEYLLEAAEARRDTMDLFIQFNENLDPNDRELESKIIQHPLMQAELKAQFQDIELLQAIADDRKIVLVSALKRILCLL